MNRTNLNVPTELSTEEFEDNTKTDTFLIKHRGHRNTRENQVLANQGLDTRQNLKNFLKSLNQEFVSMKNLKTMPTPIPFLSNTEGIEYEIQDNQVQSNLKTIEL